MTPKRLAGEVSGRVTCPAHRKRLDDAGPEGPRGAGLHGGGERGHSLCLLKRAGSVIGAIRFFLLSLGIYIVNREWIKPNLHTYSPFFHGHLNDSLTVPVALPIYLFVYRQIGLRPDDQPPRWWEIGCHWAVWCVFFKWFGPTILHRGVADPLDNWCMLGGGIAAWILWHRTELTRVLSPRKESPLPDIA